MIGGLGRALRAAGGFLWSILVGDGPGVLAVAAAVVTGAYALRDHDALVVVILPVVAAAGLALCVWAAVRARPEAPGPEPPPADPGGPVGPNRDSP